MVKDKADKISQNETVFYSKVSKLCFSGESGAQKSTQRPSVYGSGAADKEL
jgi:hypothetical protein